MNCKITEKSFPLGQVVITQAAQAQLIPEDIAHAIGKHSRGDWGDCPQADADENELSLKEGFRVLSVYRDRKGTRFWIITEADRSSTTILLPEDY